MIRPSRHDYVRPSLPVHPMGRTASGAEKTHSPAGSSNSVNEKLANVVFGLIVVVACVWFYYTFLMGGR